MAINPKLLNEGERVVVTTRTHVKALFAPIAVLLVVVFLTAYLGGVVQHEVSDDTVVKVLWVVLVLVAAVALVLWVVKPFVRWFFTSYTFTDRRFIQRSGFIAKEGRTIPLNRISGVDFEMGLVDRVFRCGTLVVSDASEMGRVELSDVPQVEKVQMQVAEELHRLTAADTRSDDGT
ncbi:PH domain-containing protein [Nocardioides marmoribigeumensis]|uniref:Membrane protein YdbT with pleckstrin-like domain n=1 Tax=Nocardioides marmoribigeumensis TaxID=433649 RepID=A0ABU2C024_9ACTN|nr:PH domain-containing protein [Nocardioides marmoribigeumensis]MDR7363991.1 putative membrane protein YdbT with pleckstrin-like domain [Nocardioides marmoribigeumensis]